MESLDQAFGYTSYSVFISQPEPAKNEKEDSKIKEIEDIEDETETDTFEPVFFKNLLKTIRGRYRIFFTAPGGEKQEVFCNQLLSKKCCELDELEISRQFNSENQ